jgi:hypothetical protein
VVGELERARAAGAALERARDGPVELGAAGGAQARIQRLAHEPVAEAHDARAARDLEHEARGDGLLEPAEELGPSDPERAGERLDAERAADDRRGLERLDRRRRERAQPAADRVAHAVGQR